MHELASCAYRVHDSTTLHDVLQSRNCLTLEELYDAIYKRARFLGCSMAAVTCTPDDLGRMPLFVATKMHRSSALEPLIHLGADVDAGSLTTGWSPLVLASWMGDIPAINTLISHGASLDHCGPHGFTPLAAAAAAQNYESCKLLLDAGANAALAETMILTSGNARKEDIAKCIHWMNMNKCFPKSPCSCEGSSAALAMMMPSPKSTLYSGSGKVVREKARSNWVVELMKLASCTLAIARV